MSTALLTVVLCPHPPLLFRELGGLVDPVAELRAACLEALRAAFVDLPDAVVVVGQADAAGVVDERAAPDVRRFGTTGDRTGPGLPLSLGVGRRILDDAGWTGPTELRALDAKTGRPQLRAVAEQLRTRPGRTLVLLLGEGSACRDPKGPGLLDDRAAAFDDRLVRALREGDAAALAGLDHALAEELLVAGHAALRLLGELGLTAPEPPTASVGYAGHPFGVTYVVARWTC